MEILGCEFSRNKGLRSHGDHKGVLLLGSDSESARQRKYRLGDDSDVNNKSFEQFHVLCLADATPWGDSEASGNEYPPTYHKTKQRDEIVAVRPCQSEMHIKNRLNDFC